MTGWERLLAGVLAAWVGASVLTAAVVAPAAFAVLPTRTLAGALVGRILPVLFLTGGVLGAVLAVHAGRAVTRRMALGAGVALGGFTLSAQFAVGPRLRAVREEAGSAMEQADPADPRRLAFGRLHGLSVLLLGAGMVAATVGVAAISREAPRSTAN